MENFVLDTLILVHDYKNESNNCYNIIFFDSINSTCYNFIRIRNYNIIKHLELVLNDFLSNKEINRKRKKNPQNFNRNS